MDKWIKFRIVQFYYTIMWLLWSLLMLDYFFAPGVLNIDSIWALPVTVGLGGGFILMARTFPGVE